MFRFANYVFGLENADNNANPLNVNDVTQTNVDDDWILIDIDNGNDGNHANEAKENNNAMQNQILAQNDKTTTYTVPNTAKNAQLSHYSSHDSDREDDDNGIDGMLQSLANDRNAYVMANAIAMEESWLVTPPPCFNSQLANAVVVETSPFENLLIEHPSMSVFGPQLQFASNGRYRVLQPLECSSSSSSSTLSSPISDSSSSSSPMLSMLANHQQMRQTLSRQQRYQQQQHQQHLRNINQSNVSITARTAFLTDFKLISSMQTAELAYVQKTLTKSSLDRQNKSKTHRNISQNRKIKMSIRPNGSFSKRSNNC